MNPIVINVVIRILVGPKFVLAIDPIEAYVWFVIVAVGKLSNVTFCVGSYSINHFKAFIFFIQEILFEHML